MATASKVASGGLVLMVFAGLVIVGANMGLRVSTGSLRPAAPDVRLSSGPSEDVTPEDLPEDLPEAAAAATPAEVLAARFPSEESISQPLTFSTASVIPGGQGETFDLSALSGMATVEPPWPAADGTASGATDSTESESAKPEPQKGQHRPSARSPNVLNDAMIASIKQRLKLTAQQAELWPAVENALRKIVYTRTAMNPKSGGGSTSYIDTSSPEVRELKSAALPLLMRLNDEQKREVKQLVYVMGLEAIASQF